MNSPLLRCIAVGALVGFGGAAQAAFMSVVPTLAGDFTVTDTTGPQAPQSYDFNVQPTTNPNPVVFYDTNPPTNQNADSIATLIAMHYETAPLVNTSSCDSISGGCGGLTTTSSSFTLTDVAAFDFLAIHMGGAELLFHWSQPITSMTLLALDGFPGGLSNYRGYLATPLPGALVLFMSALGLLGLGRKAKAPARVEPAMA
jgi:hypothetical protein